MTGCRPDQTALHLRSGHDQQLTWRFSDAVMKSNRKDQSPALEWFCTAYIDYIK
jgi:hypothetical protein